MALAMRILTGTAAALALAACSGQDTARSADTTAAAGSECVPIADGTYEIRNGKILVLAPGASRPEPVTTPDVSEAPIGWAARLEQDFADRGYSWMGLKVRDGIAALTGTAPGMAARDVSFIAGEAALQTVSEAEPPIRLIVNAMAVEGRDEGVGTGLARLMDTDLTLADCQDAFDRTLSAAQIEFPVNTAEISPTSLPVLDAATGVALLCSAYRIEIAEHTDSRGSDSYNRQLSRQRADALKDYMVERGVDEKVLKPVGYGESQPIDPANTPEARAKNERTEFRVSSR